MTIEEQLAAALASVKALEGKNAELLAEKAKEKAKAEATEARLAALEKTATEDKEKLEAEAAKKAGDWDKREAQLVAKHETEKAALNQAIAKKDSAIEKLVLDNGLSAELDAAGVSADLKPAVLAMLRTSNKSTVDITDAGEFSAKIGDKPLKDFVTEWAKSDVAKPFITNSNSGGGSNGSGQPKPVINGNPYDKKAPNFTQQAALEKSDPARAKQLKAAAGA